MSDTPNSCRENAANVDQRSAIVAIELWDCIPSRRAFCPARSRSRLPSPKFLLSGFWRSHRATENPQNCYLIRQKINLMTHP